MTRRPGTLAAAIALHTAAALATPAQPPGAEAEIRRLEQLEVRAVLARDTATLRTLWDRAYVVNNPDNQIVRAKADPVDRPVMQRPRIAMTRTTELVTFRGDFAIAMGVETVVPGGNLPMAGRTVVRRYTNIWMKLPDGWKLVARPANVVPPPAAASRPDDSTPARSVVAECTNAILNGRYGVLHDGVVFGEAGHLAEVGVVTFDGKGRWALEATLVRQGSGLGHTSAHDATYTVNRDCTGSAELHRSETFTFDFVVLDGGERLLQIATRPDRVVTWEVRRQNLAGCTNATLSGSYGVLQAGFDTAGNARGGVGLITFDGKGTWSLTLTEAGKGVPIRHIRNPNGSYTVHADCRGTASLEKTPLGTAHWEFVIVGDGTEVLQIATTPPRGAVTWVLEKQLPR
jgi:hypothetical protein